MFRDDARGHGGAMGLWGPEDGQGASGGKWDGRTQGSAAVARDVTDGRRGGEVGGDVEELGGMEVELFYEDDLEFQIASY